MALFLLVSSRQILRPGKLTDFDLVLRYKFNNGYFLPENSVFAPYIAAGFGGNIEDFSMPTPQFAVPFGAGFRLQPGNTVAVDLNAMYKKTVSNYFDYFTINASVIFNLGKSAPPPPEEEPDTDGDGVIDAIDECPTEAGPRALKGCPDMDNDNIPDINDKCPEVYGVPEYEGCPDPDRDADGVLNDDDECPDVAGSAATGGCPDTDGDSVVDRKDNCPDVPGLVELNGCPDRDGDTVPDGEDACPDEPGLVGLKGCPPIEEEVVEKVEFAARSIQFEHARDVLLDISFPVLDDMVQILIDYPTYNLRVSGHTDSEGKSDYNLSLSQRRAKACIDYIISRGISQDRLVYIGYGEMRPIADNFTEEGKAKNRRVEFEMFVN